MSTYHQEEFLSRKVKREIIWGALLRLCFSIFFGTLLILMIWGATHAEANTPIHKGEEILSAEQFCEKYHD